MMAATVLAPADELTDSPAGTSAKDLTARLTREGLISMKEAAEMYGRRTHKSTPTRHAQRGVRLTDGTVLKLESIRVSGAVCTSRAAVLRFFAAQQGQSDTTPVEPVPTPKQLNRAAAAASAKVDTLLG